MACLIITVCVKRCDFNYTTPLQVRLWFATTARILTLTLQPIVVSSTIVLFLLIVKIALAIKISHLPGAVMAMQGAKEMWASDLCRLSRDKMGQQKPADQEDTLLVFNLGSLRGYRVCNIFAALLSDGLWFGDYEEGIRSSVFLPWPDECYRFALPWQSSALRLVTRAGWDLFPYVQQPCVCGLPSCSFSYVSTRAGKRLAALECWCIKAPRSVVDNLCPGISRGWGRCMCWHPVGRKQKVVRMCKN